MTSIHEVFTEHDLWSTMTEIITRKSITNDRELAASVLFVDIIGTQKEKLEVAYVAVAYVVGLFIFDYAGSYMESLEFRTYRKEENIEVEVRVPPQQNASNEYVH